MSARQKLMSIAIGFAGLLAILAATAAVSAEDAVETPSEATEESGSPAATRAPTPLAAAFAAILQEEAARLQALEARFFAATDADAALAIEREIAALKSGTELRLMDAQARQAREEGRADDAARIETAIAEMTAAAARAAVPPDAVAPTQPRREDAPPEGGAQ